MRNLSMAYELLFTARLTAARDGSSRARLSAHGLAAKQVRNHITENELT